MFGSIDFTLVELNRAEYHSLSFGVPLLRRCDAVLLLKPQLIGDRSLLGYSEETFSRTGLPLDASCRRVSKRLPVHRNVRAAAGESMSIRCEPTTHKEA